MRNFKLNDVVYVSGDYFDYDEKNRWSEMMGINWKTNSILGIIKSFHSRKVKILWLIDFQETKVNIKDLTKLPDYLHPISGTINNHRLNSITKIPILQRKKTNKKLNQRESRLSGKLVNIYYDYKQNNDVKHYENKCKNYINFKIDNNYFKSN